MFFQFGNSANGAVAHLVFLTERYIFLRKTTYNEKYRRPCFLIDYLVTYKTISIIVITENGSNWRVGLFCFQSLFGDIRVWGGFFEFQNWFDDKRVGLLVVVLVVYICN